MKRTRLNNNYSGRYYKPCDKSIDFKTANDDDIKLFEVNSEDLIVGSLYIVENGSTIIYMGNNTFGSYDRTPLRAGFAIEGLSNKALRLFWTLVKNCKNGTCFGV